MSKFFVFISAMILFFAVGCAGTNYKCVKQTPQLLSLQNELVEWFNGGIEALPTEWSMAIREIELFDGNNSAIMNVEIYQIKDGVKIYSGNVYYVFMRIDDKWEFFTDLPGLDTIKMLLVETE